MLFFLLIIFFFRLSSDSAKNSNNFSSRYTRVRVCANESHVSLVFSYVSERAVWDGEQRRKREKPVMLEIIIFFFSDGRGDVYIV